MSFQPSQLAPSQTPPNGPSTYVTPPGIPSTYMAQSGLPMQNQNQPPGFGPSYQCSKVALYIIIVILLILIILLIVSIYWYASKYKVLQLYIEVTMPPTSMSEDPNFQAVVNSFNTTNKDNFISDGARNTAIVIAGNQCAKFDINAPLQLYSDAKLYTLLMTTNKIDFLNIINN